MLASILISRTSSCCNNSHIFEANSKSCKRTMVFDARYLMYGVGILLVVVCVGRIVLRRQCRFATLACELTLLRLGKRIVLVDWTFTWRGRLILNPASHRSFLSTVLILGNASRSSSQSFSVGLRPNFSSALSDRNRPRPAYAMMPTPINTRVLGGKALYHLGTRQTSQLGDGYVCILPNGHLGLVLVVGGGEYKSWGNMTNHRRQGRQLSTCHDDRS
jgi:hypothetical protein